jgi:hypothetical protein
MAAMSEVKTSFFFAAAIGIVVLSGSKIYRQYQDTITTKNSSCLSERRKLMDKFYTAEFEQMYEKHWLSTPQWMVAELRMERQKNFDEKVANTEHKMLQDGYSNAGAGIIRHRAMEKIKTKYRLNWI